jgi:hypothetical protein
MKIFRTEIQKEKAQGLVEFALILPLLLLVILGIMEMGRLLFFYSSVTSASREGARYGSAVGDVNGAPRYADCAGIRGAALQAGSFAGLEDGDIQILYDNGISLTASSCPPNTPINLTDRVVVTASGTFTPIVPIISVFFPEDGLDVSSVTGRTIIKEVGIQGTPALTDTPEPTQVPVCPPLGEVSASEDQLIIPIENPDLEYVYYLNSIDLGWPGGGPDLETITFTDTFTIIVDDKPPKYRSEPETPGAHSFIWHGSFSDPENMTFTFDENLTTGDVYNIEIQFTRCPLLSTEYTIP